MPDSAPKWELVSCPEQGSEWAENRGFTLREKSSGQLMHSRIGPWTEANAVYAAQSEILAESDRRESVVLYDVGMGTGANALAAISTVRGRFPLKIFSFERHAEVLATVLSHPEDLPFAAPFREALLALSEKGEWLSSAVEWKLIPGDFREVSMAELPPADLVYFDFYAPSVCPELWGVDVFLKLRAKMAERGLLITYSTKKAVRASLLLAGFGVGEGRATSLKNATTLASPSLGMLRAPVGKKWFESLARSTKPLPAGWRELGRNPQFR